MKQFISKSYAFVLSSLFTGSLLVTGCQKTIQPLNEEPVQAAGKEPKTLKDFLQVNLVGNTNEYDPARVDPLLVNPWGIAISPTGTFWISAQGTGVSTVYNKDGNQVLPAVQIPSPGGSTGGLPTGQVFNAGLGFRLANGNPARFIFVGIDGIISGWNGGANATTRLNNPGHVYLGASIATIGPDKFLYVSNFSQNKIEVYDTAWQLVNMSFMDGSIPAGYAPFNIQNIDNKLYVMYAKPRPGGSESGPGLGYINIFNPDGTLVKRFISNGQLNAPWGIAKAPASFWGDGGVPNRILVGNFGDGRINVFDENGNFQGQLRAHGNPIVLEGLWAITFAPTSATAVNPNWLYFAAGVDHEAGGLFGYITKDE